jgi:hypothetical protein
MVRLLSATLALCATLSVLPAEAAAPRSPRFAEALGALDVIVPTEWAGVWAYTDSSYSCEGDLLGVDTGLDTLCAGQIYLSDVGESYFTITCIGTATATTVDITCGGSGEIAPDCTYTVTSEIDGVRTGDSYVATNVIDATYSGSGPGCELLPSSCTRIVSRATRVAPAPTEYCATAATPATWGQVKTRYR